MTAATLVHIISSNRLLDSLEQLWMATGLGRDRARLQEWITHVRLDELVELFIGIVELPTEEL